MKKLQRLVTVGFITGSLATALVVGSAGVAASGHRANGDDLFTDTPTYTTLAAPVTVMGATSSVILVQQAPISRDDRT
jgi:hypothetical protein